MLRSRCRHLSAGAFIAEDEAASGVCWSDATIWHPPGFQPDAANKLNAWLDVDHAFQAWSDQLATRLQELGACRG